MSRDLFPSEKISLPRRIPRFSSPNPLRSPIKSAILYPITTGGGMSVTRRGILTGWLKIAAGLLVFAFGVHMTIWANIGLAPWDCLGMGIAKHTPLNYGLSMTVMALIILGIDLLLKEQIGFGTIFDALLCGPYIQFFNDYNPLPREHSTLMGVGIMLLGFVFVAIGMWIYMSGSQGCGPRDAFFVGVGKRLPKIPIGVVQIIVQIAVLAIGYILGGPVGIGTVIATFGIGTAMQLIYSIIKFEPRDIEHKNVFEILKVLVKS